MEIKAMTMYLHYVYMCLSLYVCVGLCIPTPKYLRQVLNISLILNLLFLLLISLCILLISFNMFILF